MGFYKSTHPRDALTPEPATQAHAVCSTAMCVGVVKQTGQRSWKGALVAGLVIVALGLGLGVGLGVGLRKSSASSGALIDVCVMSSGRVF